MRLSQHQKQKLIANAQKVYKGYLALDFIKSKNIIAQESGVSISALDLVKTKFGSILTARNNIEKKEAIVIDGKNYEAVCAKTNGQVQLTIKRAVLNNGVSQIQALNRYTDEQVADLFAEHTFLIDPSRSGELAVSVDLAGSDSRLTIGGPGKIDLYRTHLVTLLNIIHKVDSEVDLSALLVALATGTGKTFVQALWMEVLAMSGFTGIFAVPDNLIPQFMSDIRKLLPDELVNDIRTLRRHEASEEATQMLENLNQSRGLIVADNETLIDSHYKELLAAPRDYTFLSVDEQHELMQVERRRKRLLQLPKHVLSLFLTATPDKETFELSGERPVATMSNLQKQEAGQGRLPKYETLKVPFFNDLNRQHASSWWAWIKNAAYINIPNYIFPEISSAAQFAIERVPFHFHYNRVAGQLDSGMRWDLQVPMAHKMLCIIEDDETLINFMTYLRDDTSRSGRPMQHIAGQAPSPNSLSSTDEPDDNPMVYSKGGFEPNGAHSIIRSAFDAITTASQAGINAERTHTAVPGTTIPLWGPYELIAKERAAVWQVASAQLPDEDTKIRVKAIADAGMAEQIKLNMFHYLVEYVLSDLTGLDQIKHNQMRKQNLGQLVELVRNKTREKKSTYGSTAYYSQKLSEKIDPRGAATIAPLLADIYQHWLKCQTVAAQRTQFVDNWFLDRNLLDAMLHALPASRAATSRRGQSYGAPAQKTFRERFEHYSDKYMVMSVMQGMDNAETSIGSNRPFSGLSKQRQAVFDEHGRIKPNAKARPRHSLMLLFGRGLDDIITPEYLDVDERGLPYHFDENIADEYFRLGFIGVYASNKKGKGFSDLNLHTVINLAEQTVNANNSPEVIIQASGRNRGLDETVDPYYFHVLGNRQETNFNPRLLERDNYYTKFFDAQALFNKQCISPLGEELARRIKDIYYKHQTNTSVAFDADAVQAEITQEISNFLRNINNRNSHNIALSRKHLAQVVSKAMSTLQKDIDGLRNPHGMSPMFLFLARSVTTIGNGFFSLYNWREDRAIEARLSAHEASLDQSPQAVLDKIYLKIIRQRDASVLSSFVLPSVQLLAWAKEEIGQLSEQFVENLISNGVDRDQLVRVLNAPSGEPEKKKQRRRTPGSNVSSVLPQNVIDKFYEFERLANRYNFTRENLIAVFNTEPTQRHAMVRNYASELETLLTQEHITKEVFLKAVEVLPPLPVVAEDVSSSQGHASLFGMIPVDLLQMLGLIMMTMQLDQEKQQVVMASLIDALAPILFHPQLLAACQFIVGNLNRDDLTVLFKQMLASPRIQVDEKAVEMADLVLSLVEIIRTKDKRGFQEKFLTKPTPRPSNRRPISRHDAEFNEMLPLLKTAFGCFLLGSLVIDAQTHFTNTNYKGDQVQVGASDNKLLAGISERLRSIQLPYREYAGKTKLATGFLGGLGKLVSVLAEENKADITFLTRIKKHILRPVWWTSSLSKWAFSFVETMKNLYFRLRDAVFVVLNKVKKLYAYLSGTMDRFEPSVKNETSTKFNKTTFEYMCDLNNLTPLSAVQVAMDECPKDALVSFETKLQEKTAAKPQPNPAQQGTTPLGFFEDTAPRSDSFEMKDFLDEDNQYLSDEENIPYLSMVGTR